MKLNNEFKEIRQKFLDSVTNGDAQEIQNELYEAMIDSILDQAKKEAAQEVNHLVAKKPSEAKMTLAEREFFNDIDKTTPTGITKLFPEETVDRIFEDLAKEHPFLAAIGLKTTGPRLKFLTAESTGEAVWGKINSEIQGQLRASFNDEEVLQSKLTAYVVLPKDAEKFGPGWIQSFVTTQINEAFAKALEAAFLNGDGADKPVGLSRKLTGTTTGGTTTYAAKDVTTGKLTLKDKETIITEVAGIHAFHATNAKGDAVAVAGKTVLVVNPADAWNLKAAFTSLNADGVYVTAMPFGLQVIESIAQTAGQATSFVQGRYDAFIGGGVEFGRFAETFALEDMNLYTAKTFAYGKARDEKAAAVWKIGK